MSARPGRPRATRRALLASIAIAIGGLFGALPSALAGTPFQRGDVFLSSPGGIEEYTPAGTPVQLVTPADGTGCFDPDGTHLVVPGVGLFDNSGNTLTSAWASDPEGQCVVDASGHVYVGGSNASDRGTIDEYTLAGNLLQSFVVDTTEMLVSTQVTLSLAPDECTAYYLPAGGSEISRFNVCTGTQETTFASGFALGDAVRVLPDWQVLLTHDSAAWLYDSSGTEIDAYSGLTNSLRTSAVDPDGAGAWLCCSDIESPSVVLHYDLATGALLNEWAPAIGSGLDDVYGPPLLGNADLSTTVDSNPPGMAEAFRTSAGYSGQLSTLHVYLDSSSRAGSVVVGVYSNHDGGPGTLLTEATVTSPVAGSFNDVAVPPTAVTAGERLWIALLGPRGTGAVRFRDSLAGSGSYTSAQRTLTTLPAHWNSRTFYDDGGLSAYGD